MTTKVTPIRHAGRGRQPASVERLVNAELELIALHYERSSLADEVEALSRRIQFAIHANRPDVAMHVAGRLDALAHSMRRGRMTRDLSILIRMLAIAERRHDWLAAAVIRVRIARAGR